MCQKPEERRGRASPGRRRLFRSRYYWSTHAGMLQGEATEYKRDERADKLELGHRAEEAPARRAVRASTRLLLRVR